MPEIGVQGQTKLKQAKVLIIGAGGLGSPACLFLSGAGVGKIGLVDADLVDETNLHR
jgi:adenylyltransferase/sulfurtransferase